MTWEDSLITVYIIAYISTGYSYNLMEVTSKKKISTNLKTKIVGPKIVSRDEISHISQIKNLFSFCQSIRFFSKIQLSFKKKRLIPFKLKKNSNNLDLWLLVVCKNNLWFQFTDFIIHWNYYFKMFSS